MADYKEVAWLILTWRTTQREKRMPETRAKPSFAWDGRRYSVEHTHRDLPTFFTYKFPKGWDFILDRIKRKRPSQIFLSDVNVWLPGTPTGAAPVTPGSKSSAQGISVPAQSAERGRFRRGRVYFPEVVGVREGNTPTDDVGDMRLSRRQVDLLQFQASPNYII